jgi:hypothetical protein
MRARVALHLSSWLSLVAVIVPVAACGGSTSASPGGDEDASPDGGTPVVDAGTGSEGGDAAQGAADGTPTYTSACTPLTQQTGTAINSTHGRLDGYLSYVIPQGGPASCNGDDSHVHLQVRMNGNIYDVAVDIGKTPGDALLYEADMAMPEGPWAEGWHDVPLSYPQLGIHSTMFTSEVPATLGQKIQSELANVNHVSIFGDGYSTDNGCHDVHYENGKTTDGALIIEPLSATPHILFFRFSTDTF